MNHFYVYILYRDIEMRDPFYVGKGKRDRIAHHEAEVRNAKYSNVRKANAIKKRLRELGYVPKAIFADGLSENEAFAVEEWLIDWFGRLDLKTGRLTNATNGGEGISGFQHSKETKIKVSEAQRRYHQDPEYKEKHRQINIGRVHTQETRAKLSRVRKGLVRSAETQNKINAANLGQKRSLETKAKMRLAALKRFEDPEYRARHAAINIGRVEPEDRKAIRLAKILTPETFAKIREKMKSPETRAKLSAAQRLRYAKDL